MKNSVSGFVGWVFDRVVRIIPDPHLSGSARFCSRQNCPAPAQAVGFDKQRRHRSRPVPATCKCGHDTENMATTLPSFPSVSVRCRVAAYGHLALSGIQRHTAYRRYNLDSRIAMKNMVATLPIFLSFGNDGEVRPESSVQSGTGRNLSLRRNRRPTPQTPALRPHKVPAVSQTLPAIAGLSRTGMCARRWKQEFPRAAKGGAGGIPPQMRVTRPAPRKRAPRAPRTKLAAGGVSP